MEVRICGESCEDAADGATCPDDKMYPVETLYHLPERALNHIDATTTVQYTLG